jgi:NTE family protein
VQCNQADGVFQGGGVKALALVGALLAFAERGYERWINVAGASAGAMVAAFLACGHDAYETEQLFRSAPYTRFEDVGPGGRFLGGGWSLMRRRGLARGEYLRRWIDEQLGGRTFETVSEHGRSRLKVIAADVTRRKLLVLPDDLADYRVRGEDGPVDPGSFHIADAVRMSMSLPYFFDPVELVHHASGSSSTIVDGGMLTIPVWLFDVEEHNPVRPTFGLQLIGGRGFGARLDRGWMGLGWPVKLGSEIFHTALEAADERFMSRSTRLRTCLVAAGDIGTTDFRLSPLDQTELVEGGRRAARRFLDSFSPERYRNAYGRRLSAAVLA